MDSDRVTTTELSPRGRAIAAVAWCSFLAASVGTMICFGLVDPEAVRWEEAPSWWTGRIRIYSLGFFLFWIIAAGSSTLTYMLMRGNTDPAARPDTNRGGRES
jgi:hypothetical protein